MSFVVEGAAPKTQVTKKKPAEERAVNPDGGDDFIFGLSFPEETAPEKPEPKDPRPEDPGTEDLVVF